jgi:hypothetical protein
MTNPTPYLKHLDILQDTALQIIKDFENLGTEIKFLGNSKNAYAELFSQIHPLIEKLQKENFSKFLYSDVSHRHKRKLN